MSSVTVPHGPPVSQFSVMLPNRVGALAALVKMLRAAAIEVVGISVQDAKDATIARLVVTNPELAGHMFMEKGVPHTVSPLLVVELRESGPNLLQCLDSLMLAETNIDFCYPLLPSRASISLLAMHVEDLEFAATVLNQAGFTLVWQDQLSR